MSKVYDVVVDTETGGPCPGLFSMASFGAVISIDGKFKTFYSGILNPLPDSSYIEEALAVSNITIQDMEVGRDYIEVMKEFHSWLKSHKADHLVFWSDNLAFDWQFINYYLQLVCKDNPFGFSGRRIGDLYAGHMQDVRAASKWKSMRKTKHTHHPVDDAMGNMEALIQIKQQIRSQNDKYKR